MTTRQLCRAAAGFVATCLFGLVVGCASEVTAPVLTPDVYVNPEFLQLGAAPSPLPGTLASGPGSSGCRLRSTTSVDGAVGGTICLGRFRVEVPAGAFDGVGDITITVDDSLELRCDLQISPGHLSNLKLPLLLHASCAGAVNLTDPAGLAIVQFEPGNNWWREVEGNLPDVSTIEAAAPVRQLSSYGVVQSKSGW